MPQDADKTGKEIFPILDQPHRGPVPSDARDASAPQRPMLRAPKGAPSLVNVLIEDMGFGIPGAFSICVEMPANGPWAYAGLRYPRTEQLPERTYQK